MNLRPIFPSTVLGHAQTLLAACLDCGRHVRSDTGYADLDGPPFRAYYCADCGATRKRHQWLAPLPATTNPRT